MNQDIVGLVGSKKVIIRLLFRKVSHPLYHGVSVCTRFGTSIFDTHRLRKTLVEEPLVVVGKTQASEFEPLNLLREIYSGCDVADFCVTPVGARL